MDPFHVLFGEKDILKGGFVAIYVVWPSPPVLLRGWAGGINSISIFRGELLGRRGWTFQGGCSFYVKSKLKSVIRNDKESL